MGKKSPPKAPDYTQVALEQAKQSQQATTQQTWDNRPTTVTPWGTQSWDAGTAIDPATGQKVTNWTQNITLSPEEQQALDAQQRIQQGRSEGAETLLGQAVSNFQTPMNWDALPDRAGAVSGDGPMGGPVQAGPLQRSIQAQQQQTSFGGDAGEYRQKAQDAMTQLMAPDLQARRSALESQLANMGVTRGSEAWNNEMRRMGDDETRASLAAISEGRNESNLMFGQDLQRAQFGNQARESQFGMDAAAGAFANQAQGQDFQQALAAAVRGDQNALQRLQMQMSAGGFNNQNRQQAISEDTQRRGQTLNELNALLTGQQVNMPQMPSFNTATKSETPNLLGAAQSQYQGALDQFNAKQAGVGSTMSGLFQLGSAAAPFMFSDERLKTDIKKLFTLPNGVEVCSYRFRGKDMHELGVIAQQVLKVLPAAVHSNRDGILMVNYDMVLQ